MKTIIGPSQTLYSSDTLTSAQLDVLSAYLKGNYGAIRNEIKTKGDVRQMMMKMFVERGLRTNTEFVVYRSQTVPFDAGIGAESIVSTVREPNMSDKFGPRKYAFIVAPNVPYLEISWAIQGGAQFTEVILPLNGYFRKSTTTKYPEVDGVYRFDIKPITKASVSSKGSPSSRKAVQTGIDDIQMMSLRKLEEFRAMPRRKQTKRALLELLGYDDPDDIEIAGTSRELSAYNNALSQTLSRSSR